jgi:hypothetical protein
VRRRERIEDENKERSRALGTSVETGPKSRPPSQKRLDSLD